MPNFPPYYFPPEIFWQSGAVLDNWKEVCSYVVHVKCVLVFTCFEPQLHQPCFGAISVGVSSSKARVLLDVLKTGRVNSAKAMTGQEQEQESKLSSELVSLNTQVTRASQQDSPDQARLDELKSLREKARLKSAGWDTCLRSLRSRFRFPLFLQ